MTHTTNDESRLWLHRALLYLHVFRIVVVGGCAMLMVVAWLASIQWLLWTCLCVAAEELVESTYYIMVLRWGQRTGRVPDTRITSTTPLSARA
jgi:hypothetical protein